MSELQEKLIIFMVVFVMLFIVSEWIIRLKSLCVCHG
jgi:hypothetical protein